MLEHQACTVRAAIFLCNCELCSVRCFFFYVWLIDQKKHATMEQSGVTTFFESTLNQGENVTFESQKILLPICLTASTSLRVEILESSLTSRPSRSLFSFQREKGAVHAGLWPRPKCRVGAIFFFNCKILSREIQLQTQEIKVFFFFSKIQVHLCL